MDDNIISDDLSEDAVISEDLSNANAIDLNSIHESSSIANSDIVNDLKDDSGSETNDDDSDSGSGDDLNSNQYSDESSKELADRIVNANNGDTILIEPGTYKIHGINITKNISLQGNGDPREVIIDGEELSTIFFINNIGVIAKFNNLTIMNGKTCNFGGGIDIDEGNAYVDNCIFINNTALNDTNGGAISNYGNGSHRSYLFVNNSLFIGNHADHDGGAITTCYASSDIFNSIFINNSACRDGGAIRVSVYGHANVQDCVFMYNHADEWAGAYYSWAGGSNIDRCIFVNNTAGTNGGAVMVSGNLNLTNSIIVNNTAGETGGSFYIQQPMFDAKTVIKVENNLITNNSSPLGKEIFVYWNDTHNLYPKFNNNDWGDEDPTDPSVVDPNNVSKRIRPTSTVKNLGLFDLLDFSLLNRYSDILQDYYGRDYQDHFERFDEFSNGGSSKFENKTSSASDLAKNLKSSESLNKNAPGTKLINSSKDDSLTNRSSNSTNKKSGSFSEKSSEYSNSTYVNENSNNKKMTELFEDNPTSQKSFDIKYVLAFSIVLLVFLCGLLRRRDRSS